VILKTENRVRHVKCVSQEEHDTFSFGREQNAEPSKTVTACGQQIVGNLNKLETLQL